MFTINSTLNRRTGVTSLSGAINWTNPTNQLIGSIDNYWTVSPPTGFAKSSIFTGTGTLSTYNSGTHTWIDPLPVAFKVQIVDGGITTTKKSKIEKPDQFGILIDTTLPTSDVTLTTISSGNINIK
jgi:hypothetical protein